TVEGSDRSAGAHVAGPCRMWLLTVVSIIAGLTIAITLVYSGQPWWGWVAGWIPPLVRWSTVEGSWGLAIAIVVWLGVAAVTGIPSIRRRAITGPAMRRLAAEFPRISE